MIKQSPPAHIPIY